MKDEFLPLFEVIREKTANKGLVWSKTGVPAQYQLRMGSGALLFDVYAEENEAPYYVFTLLNDKGAKAATIEVWSGDLYWPETRDLFNQVEWQVSRAGETIDAMLQELRSGKTGMEPAEDDIPF